MAELVILGSGTSHGVPMIGCRCDTCTSDNPKNRRTRPSAVVITETESILIDTAPEMRLQAIACGLDRVTGVLMTHTHADHIFGMDDLRRFNDLWNAEIPVYGAPDVLDDIRRVFPYVFTPATVGGGKPRLSLRLIEEAMRFDGFTVHPFTVMHGPLPVTAYRFRFDDGQQVAYVTDVNRIPDTSMSHLRGLDLLVIDAVRFDPHPTHFGLYEALEVVAQVTPARTLITHISHQFDHDAVNAMLPAGVELAYDCQRVAW